MFYCKGSFPAPKSLLLSLCPNSSGRLNIHSLFYALVSSQSSLSDSLSDDDSLSLTSKANLLCKIEATSMLSGSSLGFVFTSSTRGRSWMPAMEVLYKINTWSLTESLILQLDLESSMTSFYQAQLNFSFQLSLKEYSETFFFNTL